MLSAHLDTPFEVSDLRMAKLWTEATGGELLEMVQS